MNDEQSKRLSDAADALMTASDALEEARDTLADTRFDSQVERERLSAAQQMSQKLENAGKRIEEAVRKGTIAAAALARAGSYQRYRDATTAAREGRSLARVANEQDGTANKRAKGQEALEKLEAALNNTAVIVFGE